MSTYKYGSLCVSEGFVIVACVADGNPGVSVQRGDSRLCSSMAIGCQCGVWVIVTCVAAWLSGVSVEWVLVACVAAWLTLSLFCDSTSI